MAVRLKVIAADLGVSTVTVSKVHATVTVAFHGTAAFQSATLTQAGLAEESVLRGRCGIALPEVFEGFG